MSTTIKTKEAPLPPPAMSPFGACPAPSTTTDAILLGHGSGGRLTAELIEKIVLPAFQNPVLDLLDDAAVLTPPPGARLAFTTDSYVVSPIFFPGGDIGELAVNGTVNDLAMSGAEPLALSLAFILEEGLALDDFKRIVASVKRAAARARVSIVTGDTKVVQRGACDRVFINTSGVGAVAAGVHVSSARVAAGDAVVVSGTIGDHGVAIMCARDGLQLEGAVESDTAALHELVRGLLRACPEVHALRDPTRGGVCATLVEIARRRGLGIEIDEARIPMHETVRGACEILGLDPLLVANEGKLVAFVPEAKVEPALAALREHPLGRGAQQIGRVVETHGGQVHMKTLVGGDRIVDLPFAEPLPRIC